jgi:hypothetical protein
VPHVFACVHDTTPSHVLAQHSERSTLDTCSTEPLSSLAKTEILLTAVHVARTWEPEDPRLASVTLTTTLMCVLHSLDIFEHRPPETARTAELFRSWLPNDGTSVTLTFTALGFPELLRRARLALEIRIPLQPVTTPDCLIFMACCLSRRVIGFEHGDSS